MPTLAPARTVQVVAAPGARHDEILTPAALDFLGALVAAFGERREWLLRERRRQAHRLAAGIRLDFPLVTTPVRTDPAWRVAPPAPGLAERHVELVGPPTPEAAAAAYGSGASTWTADFEDATSPTWHTVLDGHLLLKDLARTPRAGERPTLVVRPRGWHLDEAHLEYDGRPVPAALADFALFFFHNAKPLVEAGHGPYFCLPKLENRYEARLWNDVFLLAQELTGLPAGTVRASALIETITAAMEMEEILHELRAHSSGLIAGRWDYLFSLIKTFGHRTDFLLPDRARLPMTAPFLRAYTELLVRTCHRRGAHAIGGMAAQAPEGGPEAVEAALAEVRRDKEREAEDGFDGSWVAHPGLVPVGRDVFRGVLGDRPHQLDRGRDDVEVRAAELLAVPRLTGAPGPEGVRGSVALAVRYFDRWLGGTGLLDQGGLIADAATAEIARTQIWQWLRHGAVSRETVERHVEEELTALADEGAHSDPVTVRELFEATALGPELPLFFTRYGYDTYLAPRAV
ncbi:malate synthase A [Streptomyces sp. NPDC006684]|uniref:malate synthase n=1 Tax=Streptomyces sp. NPDC006684 TaxID=3154477 RepID=UPI003456E1C7